MMNHVWWVVEALYSWGMTYGVSKSICRWAQCCVFDQTTSALPSVHRSKSSLLAFQKIVTGGCYRTDQKCPYI